MQLSHTRPVAAARFDDPNLVSTAGLVPIMELAQRSGLLTVADRHLTVPTDKGANAGRKIGSVVAGMVAGADIEYTNAIYDDESERWISTAEVAEIAFTAFASQKKTHYVPGRMIVRRIPDLRPQKDQGQRQLFDVWRFHAFFTTTDPATLGTVAADKIHRRHGNHRASTSRSEELRPRPFTVESVHRQRCVARLRGDGIQPHPRRCDTDRRPEIGQSEHRHHPPDGDLGPRTDRLLRPETDPASPDRMALDETMDDPVR